MVERGGPPQSDPEKINKKPESITLFTKPKTTKEPTLTSKRLSELKNIAVEIFKFGAELGTEFGAQGLDKDTQKKYGFSDDGVLSRRQKIKNKFLEEKQKIFYIKDQFIPKKMTEAATSFFASRLKVEGKENLEKTHKLTGDKRIVYALNHLSNFDAPAFLHSLSTMGYEEMKQKIIFLQGIKLDRNPAVKLFLMSFNRIKVWPTSLSPKNEKEKHKRTAITKNSLASAEKALQENYNLAIYAEGGRSYNAKLKNGEPAVAHFFELHPDTVIVPVSIYGTEKIMPVGRLWPSRHPATIAFGEPIEAKSLTGMFEHLPNNKKNKEVVDYVMKKIAEKLPEKYRGVYSDKK
jgi:1-acyl-sn-glycerol-3-phosphate acyltransferase